MTEDLELGAGICFGVFVELSGVLMLSLLLKTGYVFFLVFLESGDRALS